MQFSRVVSFFVVVLTFGVFALAVPAKRAASPADIIPILTDLQTEILPILGQINSTVASGNATSDSIAPLVGELVTDLSAAASSLQGLSAKRSLETIEKRQSDDDVATLVASIIEDLTAALDNLLGDAASIPDLGSLLAGVDTSLDQVLTGLETLLAGVLNLVANLLVDVAGLLESLALGLTLASLGL
ncbi:hypothetical protein PUNSTDRAFT_115632 [Punctularia strigosozonata HHB-11173 SS5]|uniref:uncharacterized protein n=1 Tax=Punctularia strigosozonata (strain HHB-11173) TaxID=741275 RepID=UPI0004416AF8|nr:uncharacterized protein PUNSTDRAFT_115632 [Punctularia strigosozonata HHB-11173 SS5]EIN05657.1 hypothetical protein PUNSTDRAFT_115632 [Punctularia strigosozonata HHB-11173 SS5]